MASGIADPSWKSRSFPHITLQKKIKALVVDNSNTCRMLHKAILGAYGVDVCNTTNTADAMRFIASGLSFDLILTETLPHYEGIKLTKELRQMGAKSKIVAVNSWPQEKIGEAFLAAGIDAIVEKPLYPVKLAQSLVEINRQ